MCSLRSRDAWLRQPPLLWALGAMVFALATDEQSLIVFPNTESAISYCEGIDVEDGGWLFWDENGQPLSARFSVPNKRGGFTVVSGKYGLEKSQQGEPLLEVLGSVRALDQNEQFSSLDAVQSHLEAAGRGT